MRLVKRRWILSTRLIKSILTGDHTRLAYSRIGRM